jgi:hypothetical protein
LHQRRSNLVLDRLIGTTRRDEELVLDVNAVIRLSDETDVRLLDAVFAQDTMTPICRGS